MLRTFALLALLARMLVPAGFMPMVTAGGGTALVICGGTGPLMPSTHPGMAMAGMPMAQGDHGSGHDQGQSHDGDHACPFAGMAALADLARLLPPPLPFRFVTTGMPLLAAAFARPGLGLAAPPPPKTGPPILA